MLVKPEECKDELDWLLRCSDCNVNNCSKEDYPPMPLPIPPNYANNLTRRVEMAKKSILLPSYKMVLNEYFLLPVQQSPVLPQHQKIPSCSKSLSCTESESLGDDQIESQSLGAPKDGRGKEQLEISLEVIA